MSKIVSLILERCGKETNKRLTSNGEFYNLRQAERELGVSRTSLTRIAEGITENPDYSTYQKIAIWLNRVQPPLKVDDVEIQPTWLELVEWNSKYFDAKEKKASSADTEKELIKDEVRKLLERLEQL